MQRNRIRPRLRPHRTTVAILVVGAALCVAVFGTTTRAQEDNEQRLLALRASELGDMMTTFASSYEASLVSVAAIAGATEGGASQFESAVASVDADLGTASWALLRGGPDGVELLHEFADEGLPEISPEFLTAEALAPALDGELTVLGLRGSGFARTLGIAAGASTAAGNLVTVVEIPLLAAATSGGSSASSSDELNGLKAAFYLGEPVAENLIFGVGEPSGRTTTVRTPVGSQDLTIVVSTDEPLSGRLSDTLPEILVSLLAIGTLGVALLVEHILRRRDLALEASAELFAKNHALDEAMLARDEADRQRARLEDELRQTQRLEAVGQLAGGIAHDFNNILAAILSYADLVLGDLEDHPSRRDVEEIRQAARRGAALTRKLLLFSRDCPAQTESVDLNGVISDMERLLARAIGEEIELHAVLDESLPPVMADIAGIEQVLMNLVVNARDAIDGAGEVVLATDVVDVAPDEHPGVAGGRYARLLVMDTGRGMDQATLGRAFEPFFSTKERGRGTGLGLATVYGIVQQAGGVATVDSTPGEGTTVSILLPLAPVEAADTALDGEGPEAPRSEVGTVLLVEDEEPVRRAARGQRERAGWRVLEARDGVEAVSEVSVEAIDVLLTDVILPGGLTGADVADRMRELRPDLAIVYMSGYSADILAQRGIGDESTPRLLHKPFTEEELLTTVAEAARETSSP